MEHGFHSRMSGQVNEDEGLRGNTDPDEVKEDEDNIEEYQK